MRYSKEHKGATQRRIMHKASERFRVDGIESVGIAGLMQSVGLAAGCAAARALQASPATRYRTRWVVALNIFRSHA